VALDELAVGGLHEAQLRLRDVAKEDAQGARDALVAEQVVAV